MAAWVMQAPPPRTTPHPIDLNEMTAGLWSDDEEEAIDGPEADAGAADLAFSKAASKQHKAQTKRDEMRATRRKAQEQAAADKAALKEQRRNIDNAKQLQAEVDQEEAQLALRRERRQV
jgi:Nop53 (60S ribosomal biogenesis)